MRMQIITCNSLYQNDKYLSGYHEIHEIDNLQNKEHIIGTVQSIVLLNMLYKPDNSILDNIIISGDNNDIIQEVVQFYNENPIDVPVIETETCYL